MSNIPLQIFHVVPKKTIYLQLFNGVLAPRVKSPTLSYEVRTQSQSGLGLMDELRVMNPLAGRYLLENPPTQLQN